MDKHTAAFDSHTPVQGQTAAATHRIEAKGSKRDIVGTSLGYWSSFAVLVKKKDGSVRFCVDYEALNKITKKDVYYVSRIDDALDRLQGAEYFSSLDILQDTG